MTNTERLIKKAYSALVVSGLDQIDERTMAIGEDYGESIDAFVREDLTQGSVEALLVGFSGGLTLEEARAFLCNVLSTGFVLGSEFAIARMKAENEKPKSATCSASAERMHES